MGKIVKTTNRILLCLVCCCFIFKISRITASSPLQLDWLTPPPAIVVADIDRVYTIGCRMTLQTSAYQNDDLMIDDIKLWAVISKVSFVSRLIYNKGI